MDISKAADIGRILYAEDGKIYEFEASKWALQKMMVGKKVTIIMLQVNFHDSYTNKAGILRIVVYLSHGGFHKRYPHERIER